MARTKFTKEVQDAVIEYTERLGSYHKQEEFLLNRRGKPKISDSTIHNALNPDHTYYDIKFHQRYKQAVKVWEARHPERSREYALQANQQFEKLLKDGWVETNDRFDADEKFAGRYVKRTPPPKWVFDRAMPERIFSERSVMFTIANQIEIVKHTPRFKQGLAVILEFLTYSEIVLTQELQKAGLPTGELEHDSK